MPDIDFGQISETLNNKTDRDLRNVDTTAKADAVIDYQEPTAENNYTWYRKYASGWVEQGCSALTNISPSGVTLSLPVTMSQFQYMVMLTPISYSGDGIGVSVVSRTENSFIAKNKNYGSSATVPCLWQVSGMAA